MKSHELREETNTIATLSQTHKLRLVIGIGIGMLENRLAQKLQRIRSNIVYNIDNNIGIQPCRKDIGISKHSPSVL